MKSWWRLVVAVIVLIVIVAVLKWPHKAQPAAPEKPLVSLTASDVQRISIQQPGQPDVVLTKTGSNWKLDQPYAFAADSTAVSSLINTLDDITGATKVSDVTPKIQLANFGLDAAAKSGQPATVELGLSSGKTIDFIFGSDTPTGDNTYFRVGSKGAIEMVSSYIKTDSLKAAFDLQDKKVLHFPSGQITGVILTAEGKTLHFTKNNSAWPKAQSSNITSLIESLGDAQMNAMKATDAAAAAKLAAKDGLTHPSYVVTLEWQGGKDTLAIGAKTGAAEYYARNSETPAVFTLSDYLISDITNLTSPASTPTVTSGK